MSSADDKPQLTLGIDFGKDDSTTVIWSGLPNFSKSLNMLYYGTAFYRMTPEGWKEIPPLDLVEVKYEPKVWLNELKVKAASDAMLNAIAPRGKRKRTYGATAETYRGKR